MKKIFFLLFICISFTSIAQNWQLDFEQAKQQAQQEKKNILLVFSGSDWCAPCIKLDHEIWQSDVFEAHARENLVMVKADFPKRKNNQLPEEQSKKNAALAERYNPNGYFPFVILLNAKGEIINQLGYKNLAPKAYINAIYEN
ncbi:thioredoxin family protein [Psychroflexus planctonicus]|uniref:Thioredoxin family protein n=1 Tax=Psychroflexus planctonicus TaxID=1526575 RepID=A0ABQ1SGS5_9FLAO|nr:thioredoxin family protein [Psychroflexus planctonicus]GGE30711.1 hypothetical protein GCM10010832_08940 [Psychroflexus planctonicus]